MNLDSFSDEKTHQKGYFFSHNISFISTSVKLLRVFEENTLVSDEFLLANSQELFSQYVFERPRNGKFILLQHQQQQQHVFRAFISDLILMMFD